MQLGASDLQRQTFKLFSAEENETWKILFNNLVENRCSMAHPLFVEGIEKLQLSAEKIPTLEEVNFHLLKLTGWQGVPVSGLEGPDSFYPALARREFPIGNFIRSSEDLGYTPAPDVFHDLYGHIPFYANKAYADFCVEYGKMTLEFLNNPIQFRMAERFFWFTCEFSLIETKAGRRIFGAGILSSVEESKYSLSEKPQVLPFQIDTICEQEFKIDEFQKILFLLKSPDQLYDSLEKVRAYIQSH